MTATEQEPAMTATEQRADPFELPRPSTPAPTRPRLTSHVGRWGRARRWLPADAMRILDVGCSYGYGSAGIAGSGPPARILVGVERDPDYLARAARDFPWIRIIDGDATDLPVPDGCADALILLDVLEHIGNPERVLAEARRVLRPNGTIIITVPHAGLFSRFDALNLYAGLRRRWPSLPPLEPGTESDGGPHRHYRLPELTAELAPWFKVDRSSRTGLGTQELVTLTMIVIRIGRWPRWFSELMFLIHFLVSAVDYTIPAGPLAYHLAVRGRVTESTPPQTNHTGEAANATPDIGTLAPG
jgi:SAM-dependent methyltransferase